MTSSTKSASTISKLRNNIKGVVWELGTAEMGPMQGWPFEHPTLQIHERNSRRAYFSAPFFGALLF